MNKPSGLPASLQYPVDHVPEVTEQIQVCEGIGWIRLPLPFALDHINCWLLGEPGQQTLIDTGVGTSHGKRLWQTHFGADSGASGQLSGGEVLANAPAHLLVTHFHPDHIGLARWFSESGTTLSGSAIEIELACELHNLDDQFYAQRTAAWYAQHGLPSSDIERVLMHGNSYRTVALKPPPSADWQLLNEGDTLQIGGAAYEVLIGCGHAPHMIMLYRATDHVLIAADQVLPLISPNVSVMPHLVDKNPLQSFLGSLDKLKDLPADTLVLPSHGVPFRGLHARIEQLQQHHVERLEEVYKACARSVTAFELFAVLFKRKLDAQQTSFALGEALAHLHYLEACGDVIRDPANASDAQEQSDGNSLPDGDINAMQDVQTVRFVQAAH